LRKQQQEDAARQALSEHLYDHPRPHRREKVDDWWHVETDEEIAAREALQEENRKAREEWKKVHSVPSGERSCFGCKTNLSWMNVGGVANCGMYITLGLPKKHSPKIALNCRFYNSK